MIQFARIVSIIFHPLLMTTFLFAILSFYLPSALLPVRGSWWLIALIFGLTFVLPAINFLFFKTTGAIKDLTLFNRMDRLLPFAFVSILYGVVTFMFYWKFPVPGILKFMLITTALILSCALITLIYKVSVHSAAIWGLVGILLPLNKANDEATLLVPTVVAILVAGLVMSSRLQLNAHTPREVMVGGLVGFGVCFAGVIYYVLTPLW